MGAEGMRRGFDGLQFYVPSAMEVCRPAHAPFAVQLLNSCWPPTACKVLTGIGLHARAMEGGSGCSSRRMRGDRPRAIRDGRRCLTQ